MKSIAIYLLITAFCYCITNNVYSQGVTIVTNPSQEVQDQVNHFESVLQYLEQTLNLVGLLETAKKVEDFSKKAREVTSKIKYTAKVIKELAEFVTFIEDIAEMVNEDITYYRNLKTLSLLTPAEHARAIGRLNSYLQSATYMLGNYMDLWMEGMNNFQEMDFKQREEKAEEIKKNVLQQKIAAIKARQASEKKAHENNDMNNIVKKAANPNALNLYGESIETYINNSLNQKLPLPEITMSSRTQENHTNDIDYGGSIDNNTTEETAKKSYFSAINYTVKLFYAASAIIFLFGLYRVVTKISMGEDPFRSIATWFTCVIGVCLLGYFIQIFFES
jgi:hypothetical protein